MTQPLPDNLHPSQCYRLLDPERDTLQEGDEILCSVIGQSQWNPIENLKFGDTPSSNRTYRRPFTPPAPVQVQEFWRLLEVGKDTLQAGDQVLFRLGHDGWKWEPVHESRIGCVPCVNHTYRRRVTVPVAAPAPVADAPEADPSGDYGKYMQRLFEYIDQSFGRAPFGSEIYEMERIVLGYHHKPSAVPLAESGPFLVSVDGHEAPTTEHTTIEDARIEAERLARKEHPAQVRLLRQVAVAKAEVTVKWSE